MAPHRAVHHPHTDLELPDEEHAGAWIWRLPARGALIERDLARRQLVRRRVRKQAFRPI